MRPPGASEWITKLAVRPVGIRAEGTGNGVHKPLLPIADLFSGKLERSRRPCAGVAATSGRASMGRNVGGGRWEHAEADASLTIVGRAVRVLFKQ